MTCGLVIINSLQFKRVIVGEEGFPVQLPTFLLRSLHVHGGVAGVPPVEPQHRVLTTVVGGRRVVA